MPGLKLRALEKPERRPIPKGAVEPLTELLSLRGRREDREMVAVRREALSVLRADVERAIKRGTRGRWDAEAHAKVERELRAASRRFEQRISTAATNAGARAVKLGLKDLDAQWKILGGKATGKDVTAPTYNRAHAASTAMKRVQERTSHVGLGSGRRAQQRIITASRAEAALGKDARKGPDFARDLARDVLRKADFDARRVIATEMAAAYNEVTDAALHELRGSYPVRKMWDASMDARVCQFCAGLHRMVVDVGDLFPGGLSEPPAHPFCRCAVVPCMDSWKAGLTEDLSSVMPTSMPVRAAAVG